MLWILVCSFYICLALLLIILVLLQKGKGFGVESSRGSGFSGTYFGSSGSESFLKRLTIIISILFLASGVMLGAYFHREAENNLIQIETANINQQNFDDLDYKDYEDDGNKNNDSEEVTIETDDRDLDSKE